MVDKIVSKWKFLNYCFVLENLMVLMEYTAFVERLGEGFIARYRSGKM